MLSLRRCKLVEKHSDKNKMLKVICFRFSTVQGFQKVEQCCTQKVNENKSNLNMTPMLEKGGDMLI